MNPPSHLPNLEILSILGKGGMATVYKAKQLSLAREVAVKVLSEAFTRNEHDIETFLREAKACARFQHQCLVRVYDANSYNGYHYFVMELIRGYTMSEWLIRRGRIPIDNIPVILESVATALEYAWNKFQVVHCDIKPDNIMVDANGTIKVTDLGISKSFLSMKNEAQINDEILGTPPYMSPEQIYGWNDLDCRSDIYSLGASLYHMATGVGLFQIKETEQLLRHHIDPYSAADIRTCVPSVSGNLALIFNRMLAKDRELRYPDWSTLLADVKNLFENSPLLATPLPEGESSMHYNPQL